MTLGELQRLFAKLVAELIEYIYEKGYEVTLGEAYRTPEQASIDAQKGTGITNSVHCLKLAIDLNLFKDGVYLADTDAHKPFGEWWKAQHADCRWGGDFESRPDGNHYSITYGGVA